MVRGGKDAFAMYNGMMKENLNEREGLFVLCVYKLISFSIMTIQLSYTKRDICGVILSPISTEVLKKITL